jgi:23S rRNA (cytidine2498-2'-O)-methyltransferase
MTTDSTAETSPDPLRLWLLRIDDHFAEVANDVLDHLGAVSATRLGPEYYLIKTAVPQAIRGSEVAKFIRWNIPVEHSWPCNPKRMVNFIEKAAQTIAKKFAGRNPQALLVGQMDPSSPDDYFRRLASNLRGRALQLFPKLAVANAEDQAVEGETLFCMVGPDGLFCGVQSPVKSNGFYAGGSRYISLSTPNTISRAGGKIAEALHYYKLYRPALPEGSCWLELGACPGGMTSELLARGYEVTAIDRAPLDRRLDKYPHLKFILADVATYEPEKGERFDALLSDMNGPPQEAIKQVIRLMPFLKRQGLIVFTLKFSRTASAQDPMALFRLVVQSATTAGLKLIATTHLTYNGYEFTLFFEAP